MSQEMKARLLISVAQTGLNHLEDVIQELNEAGVATDEFQQEAQKLGRELERLGRDSGLLETFAGLKKETAQLGGQLDKAARQVDTLAQELERAAQASAQAGDAQAQAAKKLADARAWQADLQEAIAATRKEMQELKKASGAAMDAHWGERLQDAGRQLKTLQEEARQAAQNTRLLAAASKESEAAAQNAARAERELGERYAQAVREAGKLSAGLGERNRALAQTREQMRAAGLQTARLADQQQALAQRMQEVGQAGEQLTRQMRGAAEAARLQSATIEKAGVAWGTFQKGLAAGLGFAGVQSVTAALGKLRDGIAEVLRVGGAFETMRAQMATLYGSVEQGERAFAWIREFGKTVPYELGAVTDAFTKLKAMGLDPMDGSMQAIADQAAALGGGAQTLEGIVLALGQAWTKQKLQGEEALQLIERGVPVWDLLARATGKTAVQLQQMATAGQLGRDAIAALIAEMGKANFGAASNAMNTWNGQIALLKTNWQEFLDTIAGSGVLDLFRNELTAINNAIAELARTGELQQWARAASDAIVSLYEAIKAGVGFFRDYGAEMKTLTEVAVGFKALSLGKQALQWGADIALSAKGIEQSAGIISRAGQLAAAGWLGWNVGQWLREEFDVIEKAGIALAAGLTKAAARAQAAWEMLKAPFTDDTVAAAQERLAQTLAQIDDEYAALFETATRAADAQQQVAQTAAQAAEAVAQQAQAVDSAAQAQARLAESLAALGVNAAQALGGISEGAQKAIDAVGSVAESVKALGTESETAARALEMAFAAAIPKADSAAALDALAAQMQQLAGQGAISAAQAARLTEAFDAQRDALAKLTPEYKAQAAARERAAAALQNELTAQTLALRGQQQAAQAAANLLRQKAQEARARGDNRAAIDLERAAQEKQTQAELLALEIKKLELDAQEAKTKATMAEAEALGELTEIKRQALQLDLQRIALEREQISQAENLLRQRKDIAVAEKEAVEQTQQLTEQTQKAAEKVETTWLSAAAAVSQYKEEAAAAAWAMESQFRAASARAVMSFGTYMDAQAGYLASLQRAADDYVQQMEAIDRAQQKLNAGQTGAAQGVEQLRLRLLDLKGTEEERAKARAAAEVAEVERGMALLRLDVQRAQVRGNWDEAARLEKEIALMQEQLKLLAQIHKAENEQRKQREKDQRRSGSGGSGNGASSNTGNSSNNGTRSAAQEPARAAPPVNITMHVNGITDPVKLARQIQPELQKLGRLAR